jgi:hypothetical protein
VLLLLWKKIESTSTLQDRDNRKNAGTQSITLERQGAEVVRVCLREQQPAPCRAAAEGATQGNIMNANMPGVLLLL